MDFNEDAQRQLAVRILADAVPEQRQALRLWLEQLWEIKGATDLTPLQKARQAIRRTADKQVIAPLVKVIATETKRLAWDERGTVARLGLGSALAGLALFGGQAAGIAALGTAVGVPLWIIFGAGGAFAGVLYEEITGKRNLKTTYRVIDAEPEEVELTLPNKSHDSPKKF